MNEALLILIRFGLDSEGCSNQSIWVQKLADAIQSVSEHSGNVKLISMICRAFVDGIEFKGGDYQAIGTEELISYHLGQPRSATKDLNLMMYVLTRDSKLLQLRDKLEETQSGHAGKKVDFLFKLCLNHNLDFD